LAARPRRLIAIVGPTASGKTPLAVELARLLSQQRVEAVSADSRQVYRGMDIGTAKPSPREMADLPHHLVDIVNPDDPFSLGQWLQLATAALDDIWSRGALPLLVGGTGQYVWALLEGWRVPPVPPDETLRRELESRSAEDLVAELMRIDPESREYIQPRNVRRVIRALEVAHATGKPFSYWRSKEPPPFAWMCIGIRLGREDLYRRIDERVDAMFATGFVDEVRALRAAGYSCALPSMSSIGYREVCAHLDRETSLDQAIHSTKTGTHRLARHQAAWFKAADPRIRWVDGGEGAAGRAASLVADFIEGTP
jgi:tRNA dimethylallyltransferase